MRWKQRAVDVTWLYMVSSPRVTWDISEFADVTYDSVCSYLLCELLVFAVV